MSKEKSAAEKKQSVSDKATKENKENISQAKEEAKKLAQRIFGKLQKDQCSKRSILKFCEQKIITINGDYSYA